MGFLDKITKIVSVNAYLTKTAERRLDEELSCYF